MSWLCSEWDNRDPNSDLEDIETGKFLDAIDSLPQLTRQLLEDSDLRVDLEEVNNRYEVVTIVKKREPEYLNSKSSFFILDANGDKVTLSEREFDALLKIQHNPEDLYEVDGLDLTSLEGHYSTPKDIWDTLYNSKEYLKTARTLLQNDKWQARPRSAKAKQLKQIADGKSAEFPDSSVYSADWFYYTQDKRLHTKRTKEIAEIISTQDISASQLKSLIAQFKPPYDARPAKAAKLRQEAENLPLGRKRALKLQRADRMMECHHVTRRAQLKQGWQEIPQDEVNKLWDLWRECHLKAHGKVSLTYWQYEKMVFEKQIRSGMLPKDAAVYTKARVKEQYGVDVQTERYVPVALKLTQSTMPDWLNSLKERDVEPQSEDIFEQADWLPDATYILDSDASIDSDTNLG